MNSSTSLVAFSIIERISSIKQDKSTRPRQLSLSNPPNMLCFPLSSGQRSTSS